MSGHQGATVVLLAVHDADAHGPEPSVVVPPVPVVGGEGPLVRTIAMTGWRQGVGCDRRGRSVDHVAAPNSIP